MIDVGFAEFFLSVLFSCALLTNAAEQTSQTLRANIFKPKMFE